MLEIEDIAQIGVFGGSGFYKFLENAEQITVSTPYGAPSDKITVGKIGGKKVAFLPRHGAEHKLLPHQINYRANVWAMKKIGVQKVICPCAA
jgi:5'-methylthioadenosine phosphorylase